MLEQGNRHSVTYHLGHDLSEVSYAREQARHTVPGWGLDEHCYLIEVPLSELVTNAVHHGEVEVIISYACGRLWIEVHDDGRGPAWATVNESQSRRPAALAARDAQCAICD